MNKNRRKELARIVTLIASIEAAREEALEALTTVRHHEQETFDNMPESFQQGERGQIAEAAIEQMESAIDMLENFDVAELIGYIETAAE